MITTRFGSTGRIVSTRRRRAILGDRRSGRPPAGDGCVRQRERRGPDIGRCNHRSELGTDHRIDSCFHHSAVDTGQFNSGIDDFRTQAHRPGRVAGPGGQLRSRSN